MIPPRLLRLHLNSRQTSRALTMLAATAVVLRASQPWTRGSGIAGLSGLFAQVVLMLITVAAAAIIATATYTPFGEHEHTAASPLPALRLTHLLTLSATATAAFTVAATTATFFIGTTAILRNLAGFTGIALIAAALLGARHAWIAPLGYTLLCGGAIDSQSVSGWTWPALPAGDHTADLIAVVLLVAGITAVALAGARDRHTDPW
jgi:hypothetical protein